MIGERRKVLVVAVLAVALSLALSLVTFTPTSAVSPVAGHWEAQLPLFDSYFSAKQMLAMWPEFETTNLHWWTRLPAGGGGPPAILALDVQRLKAESSTVDDTLHLVASNLRLQVAADLGITKLVVFEASGDRVEMDICLHPADRSGVFGTLTATFRGNVTFHIAGPPTPLPQFHYEGPRLTVEITLGP